ncbi:MAG: D-inositol 3-phosphate glycosyltransferase [candidate division BRC1 bacterium ADurb.BinA364]|nr:MAG: D-inositol 3-phosphate glycosyltransferase [candidate division BRC1 bacterium ADurb.BinA364]
MRIGIVCYPTYGGSGVAATELARMLARRGHQIHIIALNRPFRLLDEFSENIFCHEVELMNYPVLGDNLYTLAMAVKISQVALDERLDLVHVHYAVPHALCAALAMEMLMAVGRRIPVVTTLHGTDITLVGISPSFFPAVRLGIMRSDRVVAVSQWLRRKTIEHFQLPNEIEVIYNFVDGEVFKPRGQINRRRKYAEDHEKILAHVSNFRPVKRVLDVVRIFAKIAAAMPAKLLMIGDGPDRNAAIQLARDLGVMDRAWFLGKQEYVQNLLPLGDLLLFPSDGESFGLAAAEAMACESPVIGADCGGLPEVVRHGETGILCPVGDVEGMARAAIELLSSPERLKAMSQAARQDILQRFHPEAVVLQHEELYSSLIGQGRGGGEAAPGRES